MRYLFGFLCVCALGVTPLVGCGEAGGAGGSGGSGGSGGTGGGAPIKSGLWLGGGPATNTNGDEFDTGWAICLHVNDAGTALEPEYDCDIDGREVNAFYFAEVSWKEDAGKDHFGEDCAESIGASMGHPTVDDLPPLTEVPIVDNAFEIVLDEFGDYVCTISGTFDGDTATGTAKCSGGVGVSSGSCELDGGWTANAPSGSGGAGGIGGMAGGGGDGGI